MEANQPYRYLLSNLYVGSRTAKIARLVASRGQEHILLKTADVVCFYTDNKIVYLIDKNGGKYLYECSLCQLQAQLDASLFFRANRKYIVNLDYIRAYKVFERVKLSIEFNVPVGHQVIVSQENAIIFRQWITGF